MNLPSVHESVFYKLVILRHYVFFQKWKMAPSLSDWMNCFKGLWMSTAIRAE
jgi:hypothetical protein